MSVNPDKIITDIQTLPIGDAIDGSMYELLPFQQRFIRGAFAEGITRAGLSTARGNGKSGIASAIILTGLVPGLALHTKNFDIAGFASSFRQAKIVGESVIGTLRELGIYREFKITENSQELRIQHKTTRSRFQCYGSDPGRAQGGKWNLTIMDEVSSWPVTNGVKLFNAIIRALGKRPDARVLGISTRAMNEDHQFSKLPTDDSPTTYSQVHAGVEETDPWDSPETWEKANPAIDVLISREVMAEEAKRAKRDSQEKASFKAYRCNFGCAETSEASFLLDSENWRAIEGEITPGGKYILGLDLGASTSFSAAVAIWENGHLDCVQAMGADPSLADREEADHVNPGTYEKMRNAGELVILGNKVVPVDQFLNVIEAKWGKPTIIVADRFKKADLADSMKKAEIRVPVRFRSMVWKQASEDVRRFREAALDKLITAPVSRAFRTALEGARVLRDQAGNEKLAKDSKGGRRKSHKDDMVASLIHAVSEWSRFKAKAANPQEAEVASIEDPDPEPTETEEEEELEVIIV